MMPDDERLHARDFTRANYRRLLQLAKAKYPFSTYPQADFAGRFLLWRHDVDMSIHSSERLAEIEAEEGVRATYFLLLHSHYYNLFESEIRDRVRRILRLGHSIGLHFDSAFHGVTTVTGLEPALALEQRWLQDLLGADVQAFSFHDPAAFAMSCEELRYAGMINCYARPFREQVGYCSDSNGYWRHRRLEDVLVAAENERLQVLTHPEWWLDEPMPPRQRVQYCIDGRAAYLKARYDEGLKAINRLNVSDK